MVLSVVQIYVRGLLERLGMLDREIYDVCGYLMYIRYGIGVIRIIWFWLVLRHTGACRVEAIGKFSGFLDECRWIGVIVETG